MTIENTDNGKIMSFWMVGDRLKSSVPDPVSGLNDSLSNIANKMFDQMGKAMISMYKSKYIIVRILYDDIETIGPASLVKKINGGVEVMVNDKKGDAKVYKGEVPVQVLLKGIEKKR